ncbi:DUF4058 family protein [candidate division KSB3 bacterium]|nr:DUF4058 family protein [candidate division KSB3 bacterium]
MENGEWRMESSENRSPFPGMDPYFAGDLWQEFHDTLAHQIRGQLLAVLPPRYVALLDKRYIIEGAGMDLVFRPPKRTIYPDVHVLNVVRETATVEAVAAPTLTLLSNIPEEIPMLSIEIRDIAERRLVTVIEIFSPVNKHGQPFWDYVARREDLLKTKTHLLEIDLLRAGARLPLQGALPPAAYYVYLSRFTHRPQTDVWAIDLRDRLPIVPVPLLPPDEDVALNLQKAVDACFALVGYQRLLDYAQPPPPPPLTPGDVQWVAERIRQGTRIR